MLDIGQFPNTSKPALKITCIQRPPAYKGQILQVPRGILFMLQNLHKLVPRVDFIYTSFTV